MTFIAFSMLSMATVVAAGGSTRPDAVPSMATTIIVVRHAEKTDGSRDPALSEAGGERAHALAETLKHVRLDAAYASQFQRTRLTALPAAEAAGLSVAIEPIYGNIAGWAGDFSAELLQRHRGQTILVVGHSNTVPALVAELCRCEIEALPESTYDRIYVINRFATRQGNLIMARYGATEKSAE